MKNTHQWQWAATLCSGVALCGTLVAQTPPPSTPPSNPPTTPPSSQPATPPSSQPAPSPQSSQPTTRPSSDMAGQLTATGCLQRDSGASSSSTAPAARRVLARGGFVLKNAKMGGASSTSPGAAGASATDPSSRTAGSMSGSGASKDILLMADASVSLAEHVGHQVMVTGRMDSSSAPGSSSSSASSPSSSAEPERGQGRDVHGDQGQHDLGHLQHRFVAPSRSTPARSSAGVESLRATPPLRSISRSHRTVSTGVSLRAAIEHDGAQPRPARASTAGGTHPEAHASRRLARGLHPDVRRRSDMNGTRQWLQAIGVGVVGGSLASAQLRIRRCPVRS